jgi:XTP/dITP diphosphohydrolase
MPSETTPPRLLIATTNRDKLREIREMLAGAPVEIVTLEEWTDVAPPDETGATFADNALLKAEYYAAATGYPTVAEDSGLEIDALDGAPGVHSARFGGPDSTYLEKFALIYRQLRERNGTTDSAARFVCALAYVENGAAVFTARGTIEGRIAREPRGIAGFGYDPIFFYPPFGCTLSEAGPRKSEVSHRADAFAQLRQFLVTRHAPTQNADA